MKHLLGAMIFLCCLPVANAQAQETRTAAEGAAAPKAGLDQLAWLAGQWEGTGIGDVPSRESWFAPVGGTMTGMFVQEDGKGGIRFSEFIQIMEENGTLVLRLKHFNADLTSWEEKDETTDFRLVAIDRNGAAYFNGLTLRQDGPDGMLAAVRVRHKDGSTEELTFRYRRAGTAEEPSSCSDAVTTLEVNACLADVLTRAEDRRRTYLEAALSRQEDRPQLQAMIRKADEAFGPYREAHCDAVYEDWQEGTIRGAMALSCKITMTDERTHRIWQDWLTYVDSTPPILPEPGPSR